MFRLLAENVKDYAIFLLDLEGRVEKWTAGAQQLLGYRQEEIVGQSAEIFYTPEDIKKAVPSQEMHDARVLGCGDDDRWHVRKDGSRFWSSGVMTPLRDKTETLLGYAKIMRDRTQWKQAEVARQEIEARKAAVVETSLDGIITIDHEDRIIEFNPAAVQLFGYRRADVLGRKMAEVLIPPYLREAHYRGLAHYHSTGEGPILGKRIKLPAMRADGTEFRIELAIVRVPMDGTPLFTGYVRDITERESHERRRAAQLAVTEVLAETATIGEAAPRILEVICGGLGWDVGGLWLVDQHTEVLRCLEMWQRPELEISAFEQASRGRTFPAGIGLPGRVWSRGKPVRLSDVTVDANFPRLMVAAKVGLHGAFAVPILLGTTVLGVIEFFSRSTTEPDADLLEMLATTGGQIGQSLERQKSEDRLRTLIDNLPHGAIYQAVQNPGEERIRFSYLSAGVQQIFGVRPSAALADPQVIYGTIWAEDREHLRETEVTAMRSLSQFDCEFRHGDRADQAHWVHVRSAPRQLPAGEIVWEGVILDVTARKRAEEALRSAHNELEVRVAERTAELDRANQFLKTVLESLHDGIVACDTEGVLTLLNRAASEFHGLPHRRVPAAMWPEHYDLYHTDGRTPLLPEEVPLARAARGEPVQNVEIVIAPKSGVKRTLLASGRAFYDEQGQKLGAVVSMHDVTQQKRAEAALLQARQQLEHRVAQRTTELAQANEALKEADRRKDEFLAMLAHELRNPLAPIRTGLDLLAMDEEASHQQTIQLMQQQIEHVVRLVDDLLDVSRIVRGKIELRKSPLEISSLIQRSVKAVGPLLDSHQQTLSVFLPDQPIHIHADSVRVAQVIENLLNNASKYTGTGGRIELALRQQDALATITVRDTGVGIEADLLPNIFELFTQSARSLDRAQGGLGIGLTVVKRLVEMHGGTVSADSEGPQQGSTFTVQFPVSNHVAQRNEMNQPVSTAAARRIVVVDDNEGAAWMLSMLLKKLGDHDVQTAHDGPSALAKVQETRPDIVLLDIGLPGMDGYEVGRAVRQKPELDDVLLIALTGYGQEEDRRMSKEAGFDEHLTKPPSIDQMKAVLTHPKLKKVGS